MSLLTLQRDMMGWLRTADPALRARIGSGPGVDVYLGNHRASLMASLDGNYPHLRGWIGDAMFDAAAAHHVDATAPGSWTLDAYGADFADTLARLHPGDPEIPDLARLEWALGQAFIAGDAAVLEVADLAGTDWDSARLHLVPSATILTLGTNADAILLALMEERDPPSVVQDGEATLLVWRMGFTPVFRRVDEDEAPLIEAMASGVGFADICGRLAERHGETEGVQRAGICLSRWTANQLCRRETHS